MYKDLMAIPRFDFRIEDEFDLAQVAEGYHDLESNILKLEQSGYIPKRVDRSIDIHRIAGIKEEPKVKVPRIVYRPVDLEARVVAACHLGVYEWDNLNNPNQRRDTNFEDIEKRVTTKTIHAFDAVEIDGQPYYLLGHDNGVTIT